MIATILLLYILNALTPLPDWVIAVVWVLAVIGALSDDDKA